MSTYHLTGEIRVQQAWKDDFQRYHHSTHLIAVDAIVCDCRSTEDARWQVMYAATEGYDWGALKGWADGPHIEAIPEEGADRIESGKSCTANDSQLAERFNLAACPDLSVRRDDVYGGRDLSRSQ